MTSPLPLLFLLYITELRLPRCSPLVCCTPDISRSHCFTSQRTSTELLFSPTRATPTPTNQPHPTSPQPAAAMLKDLLASMFHPSEISSMFKLKLGSYVKPTHSAPLAQLATQLSDIDFCYATLNVVSRSFAVVIQQLPSELRDPVCLFYLALRGLDSVEDDMTYPVADKIPLLCTFYSKLAIDGWCIEGVGDSAEYRVLLAHFHKVIRVFKSLDSKYQQIIMDITRKMGEGMAQFADKQASIDTITNYNLYCHYVAGVVGHGLSQLFSASTLEDADLPLQERLSNSMGLFLQKTNIIRDYLEDLEAGRTWWPEEIWGQYADSLAYFAAHPNEPRSLSALNHMVNDALSHVPDCLDYLSRLRNKQIFEFCAIPQTMAIATLTEVYNNPLVFQRNVKVRKGAAAKMMLESGTLIQVQNWFRSFVEELERKMPRAEGGGGSGSWSGGVRKEAAVAAVEKVVANGVVGGEERKEDGNVNGGSGGAKKRAVVNGNGKGKAEKRQDSDINDIPLAHSHTHRHTNGHSSTNSSSPTPSAPPSSTGVVLHHHQSASATINASLTRTTHLLTQIRQLTAPGTQAPRSISYINLLAWLCFLTVSVYLFSRLRGGGDGEGGGLSGMGGVGGGKGGHFVDGPGFGLMGSGLDVLAVLVCFVSVGYLFGFFGIQYV